MTGFDPGSGFEATSGFVPTSGLVPTSGFAPIGPSASPRGGVVWIVAVQLASMGADPRESSPSQ